jgi:tetratricopeptide (TPR) repeat protein
MGVGIMSKKIQILFALLVTITFSIFTDVTKADTRGKFFLEVVDSQQKPLEGVKATLISKESESKTYSLTTNNKGKASLAGVDPDIYLLKLEKTGYQVLEGEIKLRVGIKVVDKEVLKTEAEVMTEAKATALAQKSPEEIAKMNASTAHNEGLKAFEEGNLELAKTKFEEAIKIYPDISYADYMLLGQIAFNEKNTDLAIQHLEKARSLDSEGKRKIDLDRLLGACYYIKEDLKKETEKDFTKVREMWGDMVQTSPEPDILYNLANIEIHDKNLDDAIKWLKICEQNNPEYLDGLTLLGDIYLQKKSLNEGLSVYKKVEALLEKNPNADPNALKNAKDTVKSLQDALKKGK